jgi:hypothetical protein
MIQGFVQRIGPVNRGSNETGVGKKVTGAIWLVVVLLFVMMWCQRLSMELMNGEWWCQWWCVGIFENVGVGDVCQLSQSSP